MGSASGAVPTDFSNEVMFSILAARKILSNAANKTNPELTEIETSKLREHVNNVSTGWEKCIAATAIHNINNLLVSIGNYDNGAPVNIENFQDVAKYWSDLKGYVLSLQFSPTSPFRDNAVVLRLTSMTLRKLSRSLEMPQSLRTGARTVFLLQVQLQTLFTRTLGSL